jgi:hypothetical protein
MSIAADDGPYGGGSPLQTRIREAWESYRIACVDVDTADYDETELIAWDLLQHELRELDAEQRELDTAAAFADRAA